jgi:putative Mg2+ transporter-C (MgtC) family protein
MLNFEDYLFRLFASLILGAVIGFERHWHHKMAGLRTNILVSIGATLYILLSIEITGDASPSRIASQIVTGIGFLGAGVIMKEGLTIRGLNTAATLWCSAAVGSICGIGAWKIAFAGTLFIITTHLILRPLENYLNKLSFISGGKPDSKQDYIVKVIALSIHEYEARKALLNVLSSPAVKVQSIASTHDNSGENVEVAVHVSSMGKIDDKLQKISNLLNSETGVKSVSWESHSRSTEF